MRKFILRRAIFAVALLALPGCYDSPTLSDQPPPDLAGIPFRDQQLAGCVGDGLCLLPPVVVIGRCDPWTSLDWCGGNCIESSLGSPDDDHQAPASCPIGGGGIPGSGSAGGGSPGGGTPPPSGPGDCPTAAESICPMEPPPDTCATGNQVVDNPVVEAAFAQLWAASNPDSAQAKRREQAAWIVRSPAGTLEIIPFTDVDYAPCTVTPRIGRFTIPSNAVGWVHTHPFTRGEVQTSCRAIGTILTARRGTAATIVFPTTPTSPLRRR